MRRSSRAVLILGSLFLSFWIAEAFIATLTPLPKANLRLYRTDPYLPYVLRSSVSQLIDTGETRWIVHTAADGSRVGQRGRRPGEAHLLGLGDSFAFGYGLDAEETAYAVAAATAKSPPIRNFGVPGYGPVQYRGVLSRHADDEGVVGVILTTYLGNDIHDTVWDKNVPIVDGYLSGHDTGLRGVLTTRSQVYRLLSNLAHKAGFGRGIHTIHLERQLIDPRAWDSGDLAPAYRNYRQEMAAIRESCRGRGLPLLVAIIPPRSAVDPQLQQRLLAEGQARGDATLDPRLPVERVKAVFDEFDIDYVDTTPVLAEFGADAFFPIDGHLTPIAALAVGKLLASRMSTIAWRYDPPQLARLP